MTPEVINGLFAVSGAVVGAIVSAAFALAIHQRTKERKELSVLLSKPKQLVNVHDSVKDSIQITVAGRVAETASNLDYYIANTGNKVLEDVNIIIETVGNTDIFGGCTPESNFGASYAEDTEVSWEEDGTFAIKAAFLNPGDELSGYILLANIPTDVRVIYRAPGVKLKVIKDHDVDRGSVFTDMIFEVAKRNFILDTYLKLAIPAYREQRRKDDL
jgi:hypothetical protein